MIDRYEHPFQKGEELLSDSLACRDNWPSWAQDYIGNRVGLDALEELRDCREGLYFLGSPFVSDLEKIMPRVSSHTGQNGNYAVENGPPKVTVMSDPAHEAMRAIINRFGMSSYVPNIDARCWSGWYAHRGRAQTITTADMVEQSQNDPALRFVAVVDTTQIDRDDISFNEHSSKAGHKDFMLDIRIPIVPDLIVPVEGARDLSKKMLVINTPTPTRREAYAVWKWLCSKRDTTIPPQVAIEIDGDQRKFSINRLGQLSVARS